MEQRKLNRRDFLQLSAAVADSAVLAACQSAAPEPAEVEKAPVEEVVQEAKVEPAGHPDPAIPHLQQVGMD